MLSTFIPTYPLFPKHTPFFDYHYDYKPFIINTGDFTARGMTTGGMTGSTTMFSGLSSLTSNWGDKSSDIIDDKFSDTMKTLLTGKLSKPELETDRIEKGSESNQKFTNVDMDFETYFYL